MARVKMRRNPGIKGTVSSPQRIANGEVLAVKSAPVAEKTNNGEALALAIV
ncbi:hypothetical protein [Cohnella endophytica]|uniref:hypothetical protein n=1 Tax=Cohnella endophytica TaxID=2419778 RepID=UPI001314075A|nr:hypothetical protein [Cohnella endophytica]